MTAAGDAADPGDVSAAARAREAAARALFALPTLEVARAILGWRLVRETGTAGEPPGRRAGRIVEVEAYIGEDDRASHARFGRTARNAVMYGPPGRAYVYLVYGMHDCLNLVTEPEGRPAAVLVRAVEPLEGIPEMRAARAARSAARRRSGRDPAPPGPRHDPPVERLASGPGLVCAAFDLDRSLTGADLLDPAAVVHLEPPPDGEPAPDVITGVRVGVGYAGPEWARVPWRFAIAANPAVSRPPIRT